MMSSKPIPIGSKWKSKFSSASTQPTVTVVEVEAFIPTENAPPSAYVFYTKDSDPTRQKINPMYSCSRADFEAFYLPLEETQCPTAPTPSTSKTNSPSALSFSSALSKAWKVLLTPFKSGSE